MNGYERIKAALAGEMPDRRPVMLHNFMMAVKEAGYTMEQYRNDPQIIADCFKRSIDKYGCDGILVDVDTVTLAGACGVDVDFPINEPARSHIGCLNALSDLDNLKKVQLSNYKYANIWCEAVRILKDYYAGEVYVRGNCDQAPFSLASMVRGVENLMMDLCLEDENRIFALLDYCCDVTCQFLKMMKDAGADMLSNGDSPAGPSMLSPQMYEKFALPYEIKIADYAHSLGLPYMLHICGNTDVILDKMVQTHSDALELDYKTDIVKAEALLRGKMTFSGNVDPSGIIALGTPEDVRRETVKLLDLFKDNPRLIVNAGCAIPSITPSENIRTFVDTVRQYQG